MVSGSPLALTRLPSLMVVAGVAQQPLRLAQHRSGHCLNRRRPGGSNRLVEHLDPGTLPRNGSSKASSSAPGFPFAIRSEFWKQECVRA